MATRSTLAVILHADIVGSTRLVQRDERIAHVRIRDAFQRLSETILSYGGRTHELRGDALVGEFERASDAVTAALSFQAANTERNASLEDDIRPEIRIGIALGEVVIADQTVTGAGVVLAQRLEQLAEPGGLCISAAIREALPRRLPFLYGALAEQKLKGFDEPVRAFFVALGDQGFVPPPEPVVPSEPGHRQRKPSWRLWAVGMFIVLVIGGGTVGWVLMSWPGFERADLSRMAYALPDRPSVAVLPFANASEDLEQTLFADGVTEDIITDLSKVSGLFVAARNATFGYRGSSVKIRQVAEDLGVRYVLSGSVRRAGGSIRITAQLGDAIRGNQLWAQRYDRELSDVFAIQSEVASRVVKALAVTLKTGEHERLFQKHTTNIDSYDLFIRARRAVDSPSRENMERGEALFKRVIELDPTFAGGYAGLSFNHSVKARFGYGASRAEEVKHSLHLAKQAVQIDPQFGWSYVALGGAHLAAGDPAAAVETMRQALILQPGDYEVHLFMGLYLQFAGEPAKAVEHLEIAKRMNPIDTDRNLAFLGMAYFMNKNYDKAERIWAKHLKKIPAGNPMPSVFLAATYALQGKSAEAASVARRLGESFPSFRIEKWGWSRSYKEQENRERLHQGAILAGVP